MDEERDCFGGRGERERGARLFVRPEVAVNESATVLGFRSGRER